MQVDDFDVKEESFLTATNNSPSSSATTTPTGKENIEITNTEDVLTPLSVSFYSILGNVFMYHKCC